MRIAHYILRGRQGSNLHNPLTVLCLEDKAGTPTYMPKKISPKICQNCNVTFTPIKFTKSKYCPNCFHNKKYYQNLTIGEYRNKLSVKNKHPSWLHSHIRLFAKTWNSDLKNLPCQVCNYSIHTELAHIKPISKFENHYKLGEVNCPNNLFCLCRNHHWELDNGYLKISDIPVRQNQTIPDEYLIYEFKKKNPKIYYCSCGAIRDRAAAQCIKCYLQKDRTKIRWPTKQELEKLVWEQSTSQIAKKLGVSDKAVEKWCKKMSISKPPRGYWAKIKSKKV